MNTPRPMRWNCDNKGCFNLKCRPKIEVFSDCFRGRIDFGDIDGMVEINRQYLLLEWKWAEPGISPGAGEIPKGQLIAFKRMPPQFTVFCVLGNAETMAVYHMKAIRNGHVEDWRESDLETLWVRIKRWATWAAQQSRWHGKAAA